MLQKHFDRHFEARRKTDGKQCAGEEVCTQIGTPNKEQGLRDVVLKGLSIETICAKCDFLPTKPGSIPQHIASLVITAHRMEALFEGHAGGAYPVEFTPLEWEAFLALKYAHAKDSEKDFQEQKKTQAKNDDQAKLEARLEQR